MKSNNSTIKKISLSLLMIFLLGGIFAGGFFIGKSSNASGFLSKDLAYFSGQSKTIQIPSDLNSKDFDFNLYWDILSAVKRNYVDKDKIKDKDLFYGSLKGLVASIGDPYTTFMDPQDTKKFAEDLSGTFEGIGAEIGIRDDVLTVIAPLDGTPSAKAGIKAGDKIYAINGTSTVGISTDEAVRQIRGKKGTKVVLTIFHKGSQKTQDITIVRDVIVVNSVKTEMRKDGIYVIKISSFNDDTIGLFNKAAKDIVAKKPKGIILDLRNNPGGYLDAAVAVSGAWVEKGIVVTEQFGNGIKNEYKASGGAKLGSFKTVILVNGGSASASEIVAGALKDHKKATILGEKTFGKGSVQTLNDFGDGSSIKITVAKWLTPNGMCINEQGIEPDKKVELTADNVKNNVDPQLNKALETILGVKKK